MTNAVQVVTNAVTTLLQTAAKETKRCLFTNVRGYTVVDDPLISRSKIHRFWVAETGLPDDIPLDPNPRQQNTDQKIYRGVKESLYQGTHAGDETPFHHKNQGILILADKVTPVERDLEVSFSAGLGLVNGGHTYAIIKDSKGKLDEHQFVAIEIRTNVPAKFRVPTAQGNNTSIQATTATLYNQKGLYDWIKDVYANDPLILGRIKFVQNQKDFGFKVEDIIGNLTLINPSYDKKIIQRGRKAHPSNVYRQLGNVLTFYERDSQEYEKFAPILKDIMFLHDYISLRSMELWNETGGKRNDGGKAGNSRMFKSNTTTTLIFMNVKSKVVLCQMLVHPFLSAFRQYIVEKDGKYTWRKPFSKIKAIFDRHAVELLHKADSVRDEKTWKEASFYDAIYNYLRAEAR